MQKAVLYCILYVNAQRPWYNWQVVQMFINVVMFTTLICIMSQSEHNTLPVCTEPTSAELKRKKKRDCLVKI